MIFGQKEVFNGFCPICGLPLLPDGKCKKYHKIRPPRIKKYSGKSKSEFAFNDYK